MKIASNTRWYLALPLSIGLLIDGRACFGMDIDAQAKAISIIVGAAEKLCNTIPIEGRNRTLELSANGKADLSRAIKKLADLGVEGTAKYTDSEYKSVLQAHLAKALADNATCKVNVLNILQDKMVLPVSGKSTTIQSNGEKSPAIGQNNGIINYGNDRK